VCAALGADGLEVEGGQPQRPPTACCLLCVHVLRARELPILFRSNPLGH